MMRPPASSIIILSLAVSLTLAVRTDNLDDDFAAIYRDPPFGYTQRQFKINPDDEALERYFPDIDGIELLSPAFMNPENISTGFENGTATPMPWSIQDKFLQTLAARNDWMTYANADFASEEGRPYPYVTLSSGYKGHEGNDTIKKVRILIQAHIHGNEPSGEEAVLAFLGKMDANSTWAEAVLEKLDIMILPRASPDGVAYFQRQLARGIDPNLDFALMRSLQTRSMIRLYGNFDPHIMLDLHELGAMFRHGPEGNLARSSDIEVSAMSPPNVHTDIQRMEHQLFVQDMYAALERYDLRTNTYFTGGEMNQSLDLKEVERSARSGLTLVALRQAIAILIETRGVGIGNQHYQRRVGSALIGITQLVQTAMDNAEKVYETVQDARESFISSKEDITITASRKPQNMSWEFIDTARNGSLVEVPVQFTNFTMAEGNLTRSRPEAYVFSRAWSDIAERMRLSGVEVAELQYDFTGDVEALQVNSSTLGPGLVQGITLSTVTTSNYSKEITIPAGGYWISTRQVHAAIAFGFLEPENIASAVVYNLVPLVEGEEYPIYRVLN